MGEQSAPSVDAREVAQFNALAEEWWDPDGPFKPLHALNPVRLDYIADRIAVHHGRNRARGRPFEDLRLLDVGCGGGLVCEPMARLGAQVTGVDAAAKNIGVARHHADQAGLDIDYRHGTAEAMQGERFDVVLALEIVEHVADVPAFLEALHQRCAPGGLLIMSTLNRTSRSFLFAILGAEYVLRLLPRGTHDWRKFIQPEELADHLRQARFQPGHERGMTLLPGSGRWRLSGDLSVNYLISALPVEPLDQEPGKIG